MSLDTLCINEYIKKDFWYMRAPMRIIYLTKIYKIFFYACICRLRRINEESSVQQIPRRRSNSLPIPKIEISFYQSPESKKKDMLKEFTGTPETRDASLLQGTRSLSISDRFEVNLVSSSVQTSPCFQNLIVRCT